MTQKNNILSICIMCSLLGCTATNKFKGPNFTFDDLDHKNTSIPPTKELLANKGELTITHSCSQAFSVHSPIIWLPLIGPSLDLLMVQSVSELSFPWDTWAFVPLIGPPLTYAKGAQNCIYSNLDLSTTPNSTTPPKPLLLETPVSTDVIREAIKTSDINSTFHGGKLW